MFRDIKPITYLKHSTAQLVRDVAEGDGAVTITQNGEAKVVIIGVHAYDRWQQAVALLKLLSLSVNETRSAKPIPHDTVMAQLDAIVDGPTKNPGELGHVA